VESGVKFLVPNNSYSKVINPTIFSGKKLPTKVM